MVEPGVYPPTVAQLRLLGEDGVPTYLGQVVVDFGLRHEAIVNRIRVGEGKGSRASRMGRGWDVLLQGEHHARGRLDLSDGRRIRGVMRVRPGRGVGFSCQVFCEDPLSAEDLLETAFEQGRQAAVLEGAVRAVA